MCCGSTQYDDGRVKKSKSLSEKMTGLRQKSRDKVRKFKKRYSRYKPPEEESGVEEAAPAIEETARI